MTTPFVITDKLIPVMVINQLADAMPMANALVAGGLTTLEVTLRTPCALDAIAAIASALPEANVGAGTVTSPAEYEAVTEAGARFAISPGQTPALLASATAGRIPLIPGAVTASEVMTATAAGFETLKFFPASAAGGAAILKALSGPFPDVKFMPTGGINRDNLGDYLSLGNVVAAGGSWMLPANLLAAKDWNGVEQAARQAMQLVESLTGDR